MDVKIVLESLKNKGFLIDANDLEDNRNIWQAFLVCKHCDKKI